MNASVNTLINLPVPLQNMRQYKEMPMFSQSYGTVWVYTDIETNKLDPYSKDFGILEIACVVLDHDFRELDRLHLVIHQPEHVLRASSLWCINQFKPLEDGGNGLFDLSRASELTEQEAGLLLQEFIIKNSVKRTRMPVKDYLFISAGKGDQSTIPMVDDQEDDNITTPNNSSSSDSYYRVLLAGSSVYFDRYVLLKRFPYLKAQIAHKVIDVTSVLELCRKFAPGTTINMKGINHCHRAMFDVFESINLLMWFRYNFFGPSTNY